MKTTIEVPDDLYRRAKSMAALRGRKLKDLIEEALRLVVEGPRKAHREQGLAELMKRARGVIDSGVPDLASNPRHLEGFGRNAGDR
jgi:predicted transcriptional regulator